MELIITTTRGMRGERGKEDDDNNNNNCGEKERKTNGKLRPQKLRDDCYSTNSAAQRSLRVALD